MSPRPFLIVVTGPPASGKTTIAREIARELNVPVFHKDNFKERLAGEVPGSDLEWSRRLGSASYALLYAVAGELTGRGLDCIVEANFHPEHSLAHFREISEAARLIQILCCGDPDVLEQRYRQRFENALRHPVHFDLDPGRIVAFPTLFSPESYRLDVPEPVIEIDTTGSAPVAVATVIERIRSVLE